MKTIQVPSGFMRLREEVFGDKAHVPLTAADFAVLLGYSRGWRDSEQRRVPQEQIRIAIAALRQGAER